MKRFGMTQRLWVEDEEIVLSIDTPLFPLAVRFDRTGLAGVFWDVPEFALSLQSVRRNRLLPLPWVNAITADFKLFFRNRLDARNLRTPLSTIVRSRFSSFRASVHAILCGIPSGQTMTYSTIADRIGSPRAARAVGNACGENPWPLLVPCHRVIASGGRLGGFAGSAQRVDIKRKLLLREGIVPAP